MAALLSDYLSAAARRPWAWRAGGPASGGGLNCTIFVADWVYARTGYDPAAPFRGVCATFEQWLALVKDSGGLLPLIGSRMDPHFERTASPGLGDVGIVDVPVDPRLTMPVVGGVTAIRGDDLWHARMLRGLRGDAWPCVTAWRF